MKHKTSQTIYAYWNDVRRDRIAPMRLEIQPAQIAEILPDTFILERCDAETFRFRLAGTRICSQFGMEMRGLNFLDIWADSDRDMIEHHLAAVTELGRVAVFTFEASFAASRPLQFEIAVLPLVHGGKSIDRFLCSMIVLDKPKFGVEERITSVKLLAAEAIWPMGRPQGADVQARQSPLHPEIRNARIVRQDRRQFRVYDGGLAGELPRKL